MVDQRHVRFRQRRPVGGLGDALAAGLRQRRQRRFTEARADRREPQALVVANRTVAKAIALAQEFGAAGRISACGYGELVGELVGGREGGLQAGAGLAAEGARIALIARPSWLPAAATALTDRAAARNNSTPTSVPSRTPTKQ